ncbi:MAG TPA: M48 family metalloprotease [Pirellulales bacterium]|jgi:Zn-dependent protease with chaperone function|nr:M48 family metalloprotease [Pirellulales bacterium]
MKIYLLMGCGLALTIGICVAVIHFEADQTRESMREMARTEIPNGVSNGIEQSIDTTVDRAPELGGKIVDKVGSTIGKVAGDVAGEVATSTGAPAGLPEAAESAGKVAGDLLGRIRDTLGDPSGRGGDGTSSQSGKTPPKEDSASNTPASDDSAASNSSGSDGDSKPAPRSKSRNPADIVDGLFDVVRGATKAGDQIGQQMFKLSPAEERQWGQAFHDQILSEKKIIRKPALTKRIERIAAPLLSARRRRAIEYTFTVIDSKIDSINAFSTVGGFIYLHSALIDFAQNDQELQFVIGHEIGHVDLGHCAQQLTYTARASELGTPVAGQVVGVLHQIITMPYSKDDEFAADAYGFKAVIAAGQTREQALSFPRRFGKWLIEHGLEEPGDEQAEKTVASVLATRAQDHFQSHPPMDQRIRRLEAIDVGEHAK